MNKINILKRLLITGFLVASANTAFAADVGVSISVGQPGFYGQIDIGDYPYPQPRVIYREPIIVHRHVDVYEPMYLRVPPGHYKNWRRYCGRYNACGRPVYFVQDRWYHDDFAPQYRARHHGGYYDHNDYDDNRGRGGWDDRGRDDRGGRGDHDRGNQGRGHGGDKGNHGNGHGRGRD
ncbi:hypothetical protein C3Y98_11935 [Methylotenera oryzisoli]|uniref:Uncharacterized protein n=1 Tax=Methylotenera oryzisoli TaxID=2080758 RepID=A0A4Y9VP69_9PROT|nr:hypothetical protein [Methylotenera oryzisoli]TFW70163.1 hypothetical protein C3Y98_11935 [Methylotenera oryzisoli]